MKPLVSVLLPVRQGAATLSRAVGSICGQTFQDFELILIDDHSTDATREIIREWACRDERVIALQCPDPGGLVHALQYAARRARGRFLARMDADDFSYPERLERQVAYLQDHPRIAACGCAVRIIAGENRLPGEGYRRYEEWLNRLTSPEAIVRDRFIESPLAHPSVIMRREVYEAVGGYEDHGWAEDYDLWLRMMERGFLLGKLPEVLLDWYDGPERLSRCDARYSHFQFLRVKAYYLSRLTEVRHRGVVISGAGPTGKRLARFLQVHKIPVHAFLDVHPGRIGTSLHGIPVYAAEEVERFALTRPVHLAAVGQPSRREEILRLFASHDLRPGVDYFCVA